MSTKEHALATYERYVNLIVALTLQVAQTRLTLNSLRDGVSVLGDSNEEERAREEIHESFGHLEKSMSLLASARKRIVKNQVEARAT